MKKLLYLLIFVSYSSFSQEYGNTEDAIKLCSAIQSNNFSSDKSADNALERILGVIGASKRFVLQPCDNINNALATSFNGIRYILYDKDFMNTLDSGSNWGNLFILAHEVGHHINGHSLDILLYKSIEPKTLEQRRQQELEADEFAGFVLAKLEGSLDEANKIITSISDNSDDSFSTHPSRDKRLKAVRDGYKKATSSNKPIYSNNSTETAAENHLYDGFSKFNLYDYYGAIAAFTKAIENDPNNAKADFGGEIERVLKMAYLFRGKSKNKLKDNYGAIADYTKVVKIDPTDYLTYIQMGRIKANLKDFYGAIADYTKVIDNNPMNKPFFTYTAYGLRADLKNKLNDKRGALLDMNKTIEMQPNKGMLYFTRGLIKADLKEHYDAIADYTKAIQLNPNKNNTDFYFARGNSKFSLKDYYGAIADYTKAVENDPNNAKALSYRALSKYFIDDKRGACGDALRAKGKKGVDEKMIKNIITATCNG
ncbi:M48 family metalloprotease [Polaribacter sp.]|nr:M48 family metalloprotease [Polaribacter sp.]